MRPSKTTWPDGLNSVNQRCEPQPTNRLPFGSVSTLPWLAESRPSGCLKALTSVAVLACSSSRTVIAREALRVGGAAELS